MRLSVQIEFDKTLDIETRKKSVVVGRSPQCDLIIPHDSVSRQHCKIEFVKDHYYITDLGSSNGVFIDGDRLQPQVRRAFLLSQQLKLGSLECELSESKTPVPEEHKVLSTGALHKGDATSTIRLSRIDLNKPSKTLELEKSIKVKGPRNPISHSKENEPEIVRSKTGFILVFLGIVAIVLAWYFAPTE